MSFRGQLIKLGLDIVGGNVEVFDGYLKIKSNNKLYFRDSGIYIYSNADGYLTIEADTGVVIAADLVYTGTLSLGAPVNIGTAGAKVTLDEASDRAIESYVNATATSGTSRQVNLDFTKGSNGGIVEAFRVSVGCEYTPGAWMNAIVGRIDLGTTGTGGGMAAAICAEMNVPAQSYTSYGAPLYSLDCEFGCPTGFVAGDRSDYPIAWVNFAVWGNTKGQFDDSCYLFHTDGLAAEANHLLSLTSQTLRVNIEGSLRYMLLSQMQDGLGLGNSTTDMAISTTTKAVDIYTAHTATSGTVRSVNIEHTPGANGAILEVLRVNIAQEYNGGAWVNAIVGRIDLGTTGTGGGMSAAICAEMNMPGQDYSSYGAPCYALDCEFGCPANFVAGDRTTYPIAFIKFGLWGNTKGQFDDEGYLFHIDGVAGADNHVFDDSLSDVACDHVEATLRININGTAWYIPLCDDPNLG